MRFLVEEGIAYADELPARNPGGFEVLRAHARSAGIRFESISWWLEARLYRYGYKHRGRCSIVGFNARQRRAIGAGGSRSAFAAPLTPSKDLAAVVGDQPLARTEAVSKIWDYIKKHNLQNPENKREIIADDKLRKVFGKDKVTMFEMNKHLAQHLR